MENNKQSVTPNTNEEKTPVYIYIIHLILQAAATLLMYILLEKTLGKLIKQEDVQFILLWFIAYVATDLLFKAANRISFRKK